jgi:hypothetical protein
VDLSGIIFVVLALAWAVYLIPKALKHHDEVARTRSIDRFSTAMRVLARREPEPAVPVEPAVRRTSGRAAARAAARRRRRILLSLVFAGLVVGGLAAFVIVPWWSVSIPAALTLLYLVLCRTQVRRERDVSWDRALAAAADAEPGREPAAAAYEELDPFEDTITIPVAVVDAVAVPTEDGGSLWDPLPVTLPTYVGKPTARRTVQTIDLSAADTWTSGRTDEDAQLVAEAAAASAESAGVDEQRAVGS